MVTMKYSDNTKCCKYVDKPDHLHIAGGNVKKMVQLLWKII